MSIASEITRINNNISAAYTACQNKSATMPQTQNSANLSSCINSIPGGGNINNQDKTITVNGTYTADSGYTGLGTVTVNVSADVPEVPSKDVDFIDYDGTILYSYTLAEVQALSTLPPFPSHTGLTAQGWNWTLADIKALNRPLTVGMTYSTSDGSTRIYIRLDNVLNPYLGFAVKGTATIDWGDGSAPEEMTGNSSSTLKTKRHTYSTSGDYVIKITPGSTSTVYLIGQSNYLSSILTANASSPSLLYNRQCSSGIRKIEMGPRVEIGNNAFGMLYNLETIVLNYQCSSFGSSAFRAASRLKSIVVPNSGAITYNNYCFGYLYSMRRISLPKEVNGYKASVMINCRCIEKITLSTPNIALPGTILNTNEYCRKFIFTGNITSIGTDAWRDSTSAKYFDFTRCTQVPSLSNANCFNNIPPSCSIVVPNSLYDDWKVATNWSSFASYIVKESDFSAW